MWSLSNSSAKLLVFNTFLVARWCGIRNRPGLMEPVKCCRISDSSRLAFSSSFGKPALRNTQRLSAKVDANAWWEDSQCLVLWKVWLFIPPDPGVESISLCSEAKRPKAKETPLAGNLSNVFELWSDAFSTLGVDTKGPFYVSMSSKCAVLQILRIQTFQAPYWMFHCYSKEKRAAGKTELSLYTLFTKMYPKPYLDVKSFE